MHWVAGGFIFRRQQSPFHNLDPRTKLLISLEFFALSLVASSVVPLLILILGQQLIAALARTLTRTARTLLFSGIFAGFIFAINFGLPQFTGPPASPGGQATLFHTSFVFALRFVSVVGSTSIFFLTTSPDELEQIMKWMHVPRDFVFAFVTAVRFIPVIMLDALQIMDAQKSRGLELEKGNLIVRVKNLVPIMIPLVVNSVIRSGELAEAMESRAYGATPKPTSLYVLSLRWRDRLSIPVSMVLFALVLYIYTRAAFPY
jgi:energy-coupling factor transport system permease protein